MEDTAERDVRPVSILDGSHKIKGFENFAVILKFYCLYASCHLEILLNYRLENPFYK